MEDFIYIIILLIVAILNIILFFKIWGATNNIKQIKEILSNKSTDSLRFLLLTDENNKIYDDLNKNLFNDLCNIARKYIETTEDISFEKEKKQILQKYSKYYSKINKEIPNKFLHVTSIELINIDDIEHYEEI